MGAESLKYHSFFIAFLDFRSFRKNAKSDASERANALEVELADLKRDATDLQFKEKALSEEVDALKTAATNTATTAACTMGTKGQGRGTHRHRRAGGNGSRWQHWHARAAVGQM